MSIYGWATHACLYEFTSLEGRNRKYLEHENANPQMEAWTDSVVRMLVHAPGSSNVALRICHQFRAKTFQPRKHTEKAASVTERSL